MPSLYVTKNKNITSKLANKMYCNNFTLFPITLMTLISMD